MSKYFHDPVYLHEHYTIYPTRFPIKFTIANNSTAIGSNRSLTYSNMSHQRRINEIKLDFIRFGKIPTNETVQTLR